MASSYLPGTDRLHSSLAHLTSSHTPRRCLPTQWNEGWSREGCKNCDASSGTITTAATGSVSSDQCFTPAGHGNTRTASGGFTGAICAADTYGRVNNTFGLVEVAW